MGPDNGVLSPLADSLGGGPAYRLRPPAARVGQTFDGRDLFAPIAVRLAHGTPPARLGTPIRARPFRLPEPVRLAHGARGEVLHRDRFGNLISNIPSEWIPRGIDRVSLRVQGRSARTVRVARSYAHLGPGRLGVLGSSFGLIEVAVGEGDAARRLRTSVGRRLTLAWARRG